MGVGDFNFSIYESLRKCYFRGIYKMVYNKNDKRRIGR